MLNLKVWMNNYFVSTVHRVGIRRGAFICLLEVLVHSFQRSRLQISHELKLHVKAVIFQVQFLLCLGGVSLIRAGDDVDGRKGY